MDSGKGSPDDVWPPDDAGDGLEPGGGGPLGQGGTGTSGGGEAKGGRAAGGRATGGRPTGGRGAGGRSTGTGGAIPPPPTCGNGALDRFEDCDGPNLGGATCASATMGARPDGRLRCDAACAFDTSRCRVPGAGGATGAGGRGTGGFGTGGFPSDDCYASGGVPLPGNPYSCAYGPQAQAICLSSFRSSSPQPGCGAGCGCSACPSILARCGQDFACNWIFGCAEQEGCNTLASCYRDSSYCASLIDTSGGRQSLGSRYARAALQCMRDSSCAMSCP